MGMLVFVCEGSDVMSGMKILRFKTIKNPLDNMSVWFSGLGGSVIFFTPKA